MNPLRCTDCTWDELGINVSFCATHDAIAREAMTACIRGFREGRNATPVHWNPSCPKYGNGVVCCGACYNSHGPCADHGSCERCHDAASPEGQTLCTCESCKAKRSTSPKNEAP